MQIIKSILLIIFLILVAISDIKTRKIKNIIVYPFIIVGLIVNLYESGVKGSFESLYGILLPIIFLFPLFLLRMLGAGDIKCFSAIGAMMGGRFVIASITFSFLAGGLFALIIMIVNKNAAQRFKHLIDYLKSCFLTFSVSQYDNLKTSSGAFRFSFAIVLGVGIQLINFISM